MLLIKTHMFFTVMAVMYTALFVDRALPYWPIEVSRMAASGPAALGVFRLGCVTSIASMMISGQVTPQQWLLWASLSVIAIVDDKWSWIGHMLGVAGLFVAVTWQASRHPATSVPIVVLACAIFVFRLVLKVVAVVCWEQRRSLAALFEFTSLGEVLVLSLARMFGNQSFKDPRTRLAFQAGGVLQWIVFALFALIF